MTADLVSHADVILVVGGADPVGVRRLLQLLDEVGSSMSPTGRVEVIINRVRASAAGPSPQHALREALARFGGLENIVLLPDDAATADACLLRGCAVLEGAPTSALPNKRHCPTPTLCVMRTTCPFLSPSTCPIKNFHNCFAV